MELLLQVYRKGKILDVEIKDLLRIMRNSFEFVENTSSLKNILVNSQETIGKLLGVIQESSQFIYDYLATSPAGMPNIMAPIW